MRTAGSGPPHPCCRRSQVLRAAGWSAAPVRPGPRATAASSLQGPRHDRRRRGLDLRGAPRGCRQRQEVRGLWAEGAMALLRGTPLAAVPPKRRSARPSAAHHVRGGVSEGLGPLGVAPGGLAAGPRALPHCFQGAPASLSGTPFPFDAGTSGRDRFPAAPAPSRQRPNCGEVVVKSPAPPTPLVQACDRLRTPHDSKAGHRSPPSWATRRHGGPRAWGRRPGGAQHRAAGKCFGSLQGLDQRPSRRWRACRGMGCARAAAGACRHGRPIARFKLAAAGRRVAIGLTHRTLPSAGLCRPNLT